MRISRVILSSIFILLIPKLLASDNVETDSLFQKTTWKDSKYVRQSIVPVSLAATSLGILAFPDLKFQIQDKLNWNKSESVVLYDDYLRHVPTAGLALLSVCGVKGTHNLWQEVLLAGTSYYLASIFVYRLKLATHVTRPNPDWGNESYPSQHTSSAFVAATLLHREFGHISPWISISGYSLATWVGYSRIARNRHFMPDVLMGAALGMVSTNAMYWAFDALAPKWKNQLSCSPRLTENGGELFISYQF